MAAKKVWNLKYVVGNPLYYSNVATDGGGPYLRSDALFYLNERICKDWRCWVEHSVTGEVIAQNDTEKAWQAEQESMSNVIAGRYHGAVVKCHSTEILGYQHVNGDAYAVAKLVYETRDDGVLTLYTSERSFYLLTEQPRIDAPQPEHLRKVVMSTDIVWTGSGEL